MKRKKKKEMKREEILPTSSKLLIYNTALRQNLAHKEQGRDVLKKPSKNKKDQLLFLYPSCVLYIYIKDDYYQTKHKIKS